MLLPAFLLFVGVFACSTAVIFTYSSFRIRNGDVVRLTGVHPGIILVQGDVVIEGGGVLRTRADGQGGAPRGDGRDPPLGTQYYNHNSQPVLLGGTGMSGGGNGGDAPPPNGIRYADPGFVGYGSPDYGTASEEGGHGTSALNRTVGHITSSHLIQVEADGEIRLGSFEDDDVDLVWNLIAQVGEPAQHG